MNHEKIISKLIHYYLNDEFFANQCDLAIQARSPHTLCYCQSLPFRKIREEYSELKLTTNLLLDSFLEGIRSDKIDFASRNIFFYNGGVKARKLKQ